MSQTWPFVLNVVCSCVVLNRCLQGKSQVESSYLKAINITISMKQFIKCFAIVLLIIFADQASKLWVYSNMKMGPDGQIHVLGDIVKLTYLLNPGMACSMHLDFKYGKLLITTLRIGASLSIMGYIIHFLRTNLPTRWIWGWILILGGAIGNSIDSIFYGVYLDNAPVNAPMKWFYGQVIDMIHVDLWSGMMPSWLPIWGGNYVFCLPVFNIADVAISIGLLIVVYLSKVENHSVLAHKR